MRFNPHGIKVGCHSDFATSENEDRIQSVGEYQKVAFRGSSAAQRAPSSALSSWLATSEPLSLLSSPLQMGVTDKVCRFRESADWWHRERLGVNRCYRGESCHLCSRCAAQILTSSKPGFVLLLCHGLQRILGGLPNSQTTRGITFALLFILNSSRGVNAQG